MSSPLSNFSRFMLTDSPHLVTDSFAKRMVMRATPLELWWLPPIVLLYLLHSAWTVMIETMIWWFGEIFWSGSCSCPVVIKYWYQSSWAVCKKRVFWPHINILIWVKMEQLPLCHVAIWYLDGTHWSLSLVSNDRVIGEAHVLLDWNVNVADGSRVSSTICHSRIFYFFDYLTKDTFSKVNTCKLDKVKAFHHLLKKMHMHFLSGWIVSTLLRFSAG